MNNEKDKSEAQDRENLRQWERRAEIKDLDEQWSEPPYQPKPEAPAKAKKLQGGTEP